MRNYNVGLKLQMQITKQGDQYVAWTPALDLSTSGHSQKEAQKRFEEAVSLFIEELVEAGTVDEVLSSLGWKKEQRSWTPPKVIKERTVKVNIPEMV